MDNCIAYLMGGPMDLTKMALTKSVPDLRFPDMPDMDYRVAGPTRPPTMEVTEHSYYYTGCVGYENNRPILVYKHHSLR